MLSGKDGKPMEQTQNPQSSTLGYYRDYLLDNNKSALQQAFQYRTKIRKYSYGSISKCGRLGENQISKVVIAGNGRARTELLNGCGSYLCPVCNPIKANKRMNEDAYVIAQLLEEHKENSHNSIAFAFQTFTVSHSSSDTPAEVLKAISGAFTQASNNTRTKYKKLGIECSYLRAIDTTVSVDTGGANYHLHIHSIRVVEGEGADGFIKDVCEDDGKKFRRAVEKYGFWSHKSYGVDVEIIENKSIENVVRYVNKGTNILREMVDTSSSAEGYKVSGSKSLGDIWEKVSQGETFWVNVFQSLEAAVKNKNIYRRSQSLHTRFLKNIDEDVFEPELGEVVEIGECIGSLQNELDEGEQLVPMLLVIQSAYGANDTSTIEMINQCFDAFRYGVVHNISSLKVSSKAALLEIINQSQGG